METMSQYAIKKEYNCLTLQVIDTNPLAKELYNNFGFSVIKKRKIWPANKLVSWPFTEVFLMKKVIGN